MIAVVYYRFNPETARFFPPCPFTYITGLLCPGCGTQRAAHYLLHLQIGKAFSLNPLFVLALPYVAVGIYFEYMGGNRKFPQMRRLLFGQKAMMIALVIIILYWIGRNLF